MGKEHLKPRVYIDNWEVKKVDEAKTGVTNLKDENSGQVRVDLAEQDTYLGDILTNDGKNILAKKAKRT